jgi:hypothetical protein
VLAHIHGIAFHEVSGRSDRDSNLGRVVLDMLLSASTGARHLMRKYSLHRGLPLELLGGIPVWDRARAAHRRGGGNDALRNGTARGVARFLIDSAASEPVILAVEPAAMKAALVRATVDHLERLMRSEGGMLLLRPSNGQEQPLVEPQLTQT